MAQKIQDISQHEGMRDTPEWKAMQGFYRADLDGFINVWRSCARGHSIQSRPVPREASDHQRQTCPHQLTLMRTLPVG
jgi:hypothetical protein